MLSVPNGGVYWAKVASQFPPTRQLLRMVQAVRDQAPPSGRQSRTWRCSRARIADRARRATPSSSLLKGNQEQCREWVLSTKVYKSCDTKSMNLLEALARQIFASVSFAHRSV